MQAIKPLSISQANEITKTDLEIKTTKATSQLNSTTLHTIDRQWNRSPNALYYW